MSSFTVLRHVPWNTFICNAVQCFQQFVTVFINCLVSFFSDAAYREHSQLVEIVECSVFECNIQKSLQLNRSKIITIKTRSTTAVDPWHLKVKEDPKSTSLT